MIPTLYPTFQHWSAKGSVYIVSDTHFDDADCKTMDPNWITPEEHIATIAKRVHKNDTLIHLGDVGNPAYLAHAWKPNKRPHMVLIMGNHDVSVEKYEPYFDEIYTGVLAIAEKIILSHEPIQGLDWCLNIHGHDHAGKAHDKHHLNLAANVVGYKLTNLDDVIKGGGVSKIRSIHRETIDRATQRKQSRGGTHRN